MTDIFGLSAELERPQIARLHNIVKPYAWGSTSFIQDLLGAGAPGQPAAEMWMGAHPAAPSNVEFFDPDRFGSELPQTLTEMVEQDPARVLGSSTFERFGQTLPFLLKVLAADKPLSIQAHPTREQARAGCADEDSRGIPRDSPTRNYVDANHKPEIISALTDFDALCGFRPVEKTAELLQLLFEHGAAKLDGFSARLVSDGGLRDVVTSILTMPQAWQADMLDSVVPAAQRVAAADGDWSAECSWTARLVEFYPGDPGVVLALLMNLVRLRPGQALFLSAGRIHAYLQGAGVELMASSDNVLRCGLTAKHVDPPELLRVLDFSTECATPLNPSEEGRWAHYPVPIEDFTLSRLTLPADGAPGRLHSLQSAGPQIVLVTEGSMTIRCAGAPELSLQRGGSAFLAAGVEAAVGGIGELFQATTNLGV